MPDMHERGTEEKFARIRLIFKRKKWKKEEDKSGFHMDRRKKNKK